MSSSHTTIRTNTARRAGETRQCGVKSLEVFTCDGSKAKHASSEYRVCDHRLFRYIANKNSPTVWRHACNVFDSLTDIWYSSSTDTTTNGTSSLVLQWEMFPNESTPVIWPMHLQGTRTTSCCQTGRRSRLRGAFTSCYL